MSREPSQESKPCQQCHTPMTRDMRTQSAWDKKKFCNNSCANRFNQLSRYLKPKARRAPQTKPCKSCGLTLTEKLRKDGQFEGWISFAKRSYCDSCKKPHSYGHNYGWGQA